MSPEDGSDEVPRRIMMPEKWDAKVWRYLSLASLLSILQTKSLFFPRIEKLDDPYEGAMPEALKTFFADAEQEFGNRTVKVTTVLDAHSKLSCVNCWHANDVESAAMWKLYAQDSGLAIQSSVGGLIQGFLSVAGINMALVQYVDFESDELPKLPYPVYLKRKSFSHEHELRVVIQDVDITAQPDGVLVPVDLSRLIERVYVSPSAPAWIAHVVRRELELYELKVDVIHSSLYSRQLR
jgi:hypothetical protein